jgi:hypothetical protein
MSAAFDFLVNTAGGLLMNLGVSGMVGQLLGVGATLALHPLLLLTGIVVGGAGIAIARELNKRPQLQLVVDNWTLDKKSCSRKYNANKQKINLVYSYQQKKSIAIRTPMHSNINYKL